MLEALNESMPVILVVDDFHLADDASLAVLHLLLRRALDQRTLLILIARPGELALGTQARRLREMAAGPHIRELDLQPLSHEDSQELLERLADGAAISPPLFGPEGLPGRRWRLPPSS